MPLPPLPLTQSQRRLIRQLDELWNWADTKLSGHPLPEDDLRLTVLFQLSGATHRLVRAIIAQVWGGSVDGLEGRMRSMIEALINIRYILAEQKDTRARAFIVDDQRSRRKVCNWMIPLMANGKAPSMALNITLDFWKNQEAKLAEELADLESHYGRDDLKWPSLEERARLGDT
jgi:hypothetical protein